MIDGDSSRTGKIDLGQLFIRHALHGWRLDCRQSVQFTLFEPFAGTDSKIGNRAHDFLRAIGLGDMLKLFSRNEKNRESAAKSTEARFNNLPNTIISLDREIAYLLNSLHESARSLSRFETSSRKKRLIESIEENGELLSVILDSRRNPARVNGRLSSPVEVDFSLQDLLNRIHQLFRSRVLEKGLDFSLDLGNSTLGIFRGCKHSLARIAVHLVNDAITCTQAGEVGVTAMVRNRNLVLSVSDAGDGTATVEHGPAEAGRLCERLGGTISRMSEEGIGSITMITLPLEKADLDRYEHNPGDAMVKRWLAKFKNNPDLEKVLFIALFHLREESRALREAIHLDDYFNILEKINSMKTFPGGFSLTEIDEELKALESAVKKRPYDRQAIETHLIAFQVILDSIPFEYYKIGRELDSRITGPRTGDKPKDCGP